MRCSICNTPILLNQRYYLCKIDAGEYQTPELEAGVSTVHLHCVEEQMLQGNATMTEAGLSWMRAAKNAQRFVGRLSRQTMNKVREVASKCGDLVKQDDPSWDGTKGGTVCLRLSIPEIGLCQWRNITNHRE